MGKRQGLDCDFWGDNPDGKIVICPEHSIIPREKMFANGGEWYQKVLDGEIKEP